MTRLLILMAVLLAYEGLLYWVGRHWMPPSRHSLWATVMVVGGGALVGVFLMPRVIDAEAAIRGMDDAGSRRRDN